MPSLRAAGGDTRTSTSSASSRRRRAPPGAGRRSSVTPVQAVAEELGIPAILAPDRLRDPARRRRGRWRSDPDLLVLADYGQIVPAALLEPRHGALNLHPSLLPTPPRRDPDPGRDPGRRCDDGRHRSSAWTTASTPGRSSPRRRLPLEGDETTPVLEAILASQGADAAGRTVGPWLRGEIAARPQPDRGRDIDPAVAARGRPARPGAVRRSSSSARSGRTSRGRARTSTPPFGRLVVWSAVADGDGPAAGTFDELGLGVGTGERLRLIEVQPAGGRRMPWDDFLRGRPSIAGSAIEPGR